ncbi:hypothetical protein EVG20_g4837 [Dentipellis fragilis]|uniref:RED-like N-terminal domain-containing protein n=1 Tax=Dentipellis fragilis TaxID=205917 RepID=A0A4Y9YXG8_9AGAM|nr:hypothetical protein EVG20_g4837 [Dentipellis fragilis]
MTQGWSAMFTYQTPFASVSDSAPGFPQSPLGSESAASRSRGGCAESQTFADPRLEKENDLGAASGLQRWTRKLLQTPRPGGNNGTPTGRGSFLSGIAGPSQIKTVVAASEPAFKPRKVKKSGDSKYRDRATERRIGKESDYAKVEALLEDFEKQNAEIEDREKVEEQRKYLGGDSDHSILVKGLDFALLEQQKARLASVNSKIDDESLEEAFLQTAEPAVKSGTKRSRADLIRDLKEKRAGGRESSGSAPPEEKKTNDKFKPIGFKPIGAPAEEKGKKKKKVKAGDEGERKKKKRKVVSEEEKSLNAAKTEMAPLPTESPAVEVSTSILAPEPADEPVDEDFDIFAGAGDYEGLELGDDEEEEGEVDQDSLQAEKPPSAAEPPPVPSSTVTRRNWFDDKPEASPPLQTDTPGPSTAQAKPPPSPPTLEAGEEEEEPTRLVPLSSSAVPSIRDLLAMDEAAEKDKKRRERKEKKKDKGGGGDKLDRDYQRLKSYEAKKAAG